MQIVATADYSTRCQGFCDCCRTAAVNQSSFISSMSERRRWYRLNAKSNECILLMGQLSIKILDVTVATFEVIIIYFCYFNRMSYLLHLLRNKLHKLHEVIRHETLLVILYKCVKYMK